MLRILKSCPLNMPARSIIYHANNSLPRFMRQVVRPALLYVSQMWATNKRDEDRLAVVEMRMPRWMNGWTRADRVKNRFVRDSMKAADIRLRVTERRLKWFGHVKRREEEHVLRRAESMELPGSRGSGRPRRRWKDAVGRDLRKLGLLEGEVFDRRRWKRKVTSECRDPS